MRQFAAWPKLEGGVFVVAFLKRVWQNPLTMMYIALILLIFIAWQAHAFLSLALFTVIFIYLGNAANRGHRAAPAPASPMGDAAGVRVIPGNLGGGLFTDHSAAGVGGLEPAEHD